MKNRMRSVILIVLLFMGFSGKSQQAIVDPQGDFEWKSDSLWYVNDIFFAAKDTIYNMALTFPQYTDDGYLFARIAWGDGKYSPAWSLAGRETFSHKYGEGDYNAQVLLYYDKADTVLNSTHNPADTVNRIVFNRYLSTDFSIHGKYVDVCMPENEKKDTVTVKFSNFFNPPGTVNEVYMTMNGQPLSTEIADTCCSSRDSICLIYTRPSGVNSYEVQVKLVLNTMASQDATPNMNISRDMGRKNFQIFKHPSLAEIFHFPDTLNVERGFDNFTICAPNPPEEFSYDALLQSCYQTGGNNPSFENRRNMEVDYYFTSDTVASKISWKKVSSDTSYVDSMTMIFKKPGFYKMFITAMNGCSNERDTLRTEDIYDADKYDPARNLIYGKRYIQVFKNAKDALYYISDSLSCFEDTLTFVDRNERAWFDEYPFYFFEGTEINKGITYTRDSAWYTIHSFTYYKDGSVVDGSEGSDSVRVEAIFNRVGNFDLRFYRKTQSCDSIFKSFPVTIGGMPEFSVKDTVLFNILSRRGITVNVDTSVIDHCGLFSYAFPDFTPAIDTNYLSLDSVAFHLSKGGVDTVIYGLPSLTGTFEFDSIGNIVNHIKVKARNQCGWSNADSVMFYTRVQPEVEIWRDGVKNNDTICERTEYKYLIKGVLPEKHINYYRFDNPVYQNGNLIQNTGRYVEFNEDGADDIFEYRFVTGVVEDFIIVNEDAYSCRDTLLSLMVQTMPVPAITVANKSVFYCDNTPSLDISSIVSNPAYMRADWKLAGDSIRTGENMLRSDIVLSLTKKDTLAITVSNGGGCYRNDTVKFFPITSPKLTLTDDETLCFFESSIPLNIADYVETSNNGTGGIKMSVTGSFNGSSFPVYETGKPNFPGNINLQPHNVSDKGYFIYNITNDSLSQGIRSDGKSTCLTADTLTFLCLHPKLQLVSADTFNYVAGFAYDFAQSKSKPLSNLDTSAMTYRTYEWKVVEGSGSISRKSVVADSIWDWEYTYDPVNDLSRDSLLFEVSAHAHCGELLKDTMTVYVAKTALTAFHAEICENTEDYALWGAGKTHGNYIDTATLEWSIVNVDGGGKLWGNIAPSTGGSAKYSTVSGNGLESGDTLKIAVKGRYNNQSNYVYDTVLLAINPAPYATHSLGSGDELITNDGIIELSRIKMIKFHHAADTSFYNPSAGMTIQSPNVLSFDNTNSWDRTNHTGTAKIVLRGLPGCSNDTTAAFNFMHPVTTVISIKNGLTLCAGDSLTLSSTYNIIGDKYTVFQWENETNIGGFNADSTKFRTSSTNSHGIEKINVKTSKSYYTYDSIAHTGKGQSSAAGSISIYAKPDISISLSNKADTICSLEVVYQPQNWASAISVTPGVYFDSLRINGRKLGEIPTNKPTSTYDTLIVTTNLGNCWKDIKDSIFIYRSPALYSGDFTISDICENGTGFLVNTSGLTLFPDANYYWTSGGLELDTLGNGLNPKYSAASGHNGSGYITLHIFEGQHCEDTISKPLSIFESPAADADFPVKSISQTKLNEQMMFIRTSPVGNVQTHWLIKDLLVGTRDTLVHTFNIEEATNIKLAIETQDGCRDTASYDIHVVPPPILNISATVDSCTGIVTLNNASEYKKAVIHEWDFSNGPLAAGQPSSSTDSLPGNIIYDRVYSDTTFYITLTLGNAADTLTQSIEVTLVSKLEANISFAPGIDGCSDVTRFIGNNTIGTIDSLFVDWGDGYTEMSKDNLKLFHHKYVHNSSYNIEHYVMRLEAYNKCESDVAILPIAIHPINAKPVIELDDDPKYAAQCYGTPIGFINSSLGYGGANYSATWFFEENQSVRITDETKKDTAYTFQDPGTYTVKLIMSDRCNTDTVSMDVTVKGSRDLSIIMPSEPYCESQPIAMSASNAVFSNYEWSFGDGQTANGKSNVSHAYDYNNNVPWYVTLKAVSDGCPTDASTLVNVKRTPQARISTKNFSNTDYCSELVVTFDGINDNPNIYNPNIYWDFGNGETATGWLDQIATYRLEQDYGAKKDSVFHVMMLVTSAEGCSDTAEIKDITVKYMPDAEFSINKELFCTTDSNFTVKLVNNSALKEYSSYEWYSDNSTTPFSLLPDPDSIRLNGVGERAIRLVATHKTNYCKSEHIIKFAASKSVEADFLLTPETACEGLSFDIEPVVLSEVGLKWNMGDNTGFSEYTGKFSYTYDNVGDYTIQLIATNGDRCTDTIEKKISVNPVATAAFNWEKDYTVAEGYPGGMVLPDIENGGVRFTNESSYADQNGKLYYYWNFGDSSVISSEKDPTHEFKSSGSFNVSLKVKTEFGCVDSTATVITMNHLKGLHIPTAFAPSIQDDGIKIFQPKGVGLSSYTIQIYDKWGKFLWSSSELSATGQPLDGWDGRFQGEEMPKGVYIWRINAIFADGEVWSKKGKISGLFTLIR